MAQRELKLSVITPERRVLERSVDSVVIPAHDGELGVLPHRASLMCELGIGVLTAKRAGAEERLMIDGGFAQVYADVVTVLTERALTPADITPDRLAAAQKECSGSEPDTPALERRRKARNRLRAMQRTIV